jgi:hypothetical protein
MCIQSNVDDVASADTELFMHIEHMLQHIIINARHLCQLYSIRENHLSMVCELVL